MSEEKTDKRPYMTRLDRIAAIILILIALGICLGVWYTVMTYGVTP